MFHLDPSIKKTKVVVLHFDLPEAHCWGQHDIGPWDLSQMVRVL